MNSPRFSIIIPTYNRRKLLQRAVESVLAQNYDNWELIIVDDGSIDHTKEYVYSIKNDRVQYYYQENNGESSARNLGLKKSKGQYICFVDSDDKILPNYLKLFSININDKVNMLCCGVRLQWEDRNKNIDIVPSNNNKKFIKQVLTGHFNLMPFCFKKNITNLFSEDVEMGEDFMFIVPLVANNTTLIIDEIQCVVYEHAGRFTRSKYETPRIDEFKKSSIDIINQHRSKFEKTLTEIEVDDIIRDKLTNYILGISQHSIASAMQILESTKTEYPLRHMKDKIVFRRVKYLVKTIFSKL